MLPSTFSESRLGPELQLYITPTLETGNVWDLAEGFPVVSKVESYSGPLFKMARKRYVSSIPKFLRTRSSGQRVKHYPRRPKAALAALFRRALFQLQRKKTHAWARDFKVYRKKSLTAKYNRDRVARRRNAIRRARR